MRKERLIYLVLVVICIIAGLASRKYGSMLPVLVAEYAGDILWAAMVYFGFRFLLPASGIRTAGIWALFFSWCREFSQLYQAEWIRQVRANPFAALVLGQGFLWSDLVCYTIGIAVAFGIDLFVFTHHR
ncbi:MAG: DUF2809 domain-containing protein [Tannerellaceae bacterium]|nr:DUF2809 domain-containing protein [Tannerellaceae bacterium]